MKKYIAHHNVPNITDEEHERRLKIVEDTLSNLLNAKIILTYKEEKK